MRRLITLIGLAAVLYGCNIGNDEVKEDTLEGVPISEPQTLSSRLDKGISFMVHSEGEEILCYTDKNAAITAYTDAAAIISSELLDGDDEPLVMRGHYDGSKFRVTHVSANGHGVNF